MKSPVTRFLFLLVFSIVAGSPWADATDLGLGQGVSFSQVSYPDDPAGANTTVGIIRVDLNRLRNTSGMASGYINVTTASGWVVRNLPVLAENLYPYSQISTEFDLGITPGTAVSQIMASLQYSETLVTSFSTPPAMSSFPVGSIELSTGGTGIGDGEPVAPPDATDVLFGNPADNDTITQLDHPNLQAAFNQCMPMAVANSLQYLKDTQGLQLPHAHKEGLKGDDSLVGKLDETYQRTVPDVHDRRHGGPIQVGLQGKLTYLAANNLAGRVSTTFWGAAANDTGTQNISTTVNGVTATATAMGANVNFDQVLQALKEGQDCEMSKSWPVKRSDGTTGYAGHTEDIVGAGKFRGQPWLISASDINQGNDSKGAGPEGFRFNFLSGPDQNGKYHWPRKKKNPNDPDVSEELSQVICEKYVAPPVTETVNSVNDPRGHSCCVNAPPATVSLSVSGSNMTVSGSASWMPMSGSIAADGSFNLAGSGTVAGFNNVSSSFVGTSSGGIYTGTITVGTRGELYGVPISWGVTINAQSSVAIPALRVNGFRHEHTANSNDLLRIALTMKAGAQKDRQGDWWLVAVIPGAVGYFDLASMTWKGGIAATYTGPLSDIDYLPLPYVSLPPGTYDFYFGFDGVPDGALSVPSLIYDTVRVTVN